MDSAQRKLSSLFELAKKFNCFYLSGLHKGECRPFVVDGHHVGLIRPDVLKKLLMYPEVFLIQPDYVELNPAFRDFEERSAKIDKVLRNFRDKNAFVTLKGWRDECYEVKAAFSDPPLLEMERSAVCLFGIKQYGVDINGYVNHPEKGLCLWFQRRAPTKQTWPGKWDNMVSGGFSVGYGIEEAAIKEAYEEASVPKELLSNLKAAGSVSFFYECDRGLFPNTEFIFDVELPLDFIPKNNDGEVDKFELIPAKFAIERIVAPEFKLSSAPVVIDFLIRHGFITPETESYFPQIIELLHVPLQTLYKGPRSTNNGIAS